jgi:type IV pilus assembly protein PilM
VFGRAKALVGLDIGSSAVKAIELKPVGKGYKVTAFGSEPVPPDSIVDGAIIDGAAVVDAIRRLFEARNIKTWRRRCRAMPSSSRRLRCRR